MIKEFFGFDGYMREPEGYLSWQHLAFVTSLMAVMILFAVLLGRRRWNMPDAVKNRVLIAAAIMMDGFEILKILLLCTLGGDPMAWLHELPLYMCSIQLITLPMAAFARGRLREAALDFVCIFGLLGAVLGTYGAGQNYASYPVISFTNVVSGMTHAISGFSALYIMISGMASMKRKNIAVTFAIITGFAVAAFIANCILDTNYMFLVRGDGTPYDILYDLVSGSPVLYPVGVVVLFYIYIALFAGIFRFVRMKRA